LPAVLNLTTEKNKREKNFALGFWLCFFSKRYRELQCLMPVGGETQAAAGDFVV